MSAPAAGVAGNGMPLAFNGELVELGMLPLTRLLGLLYDLFQDRTAGSPVSNFKTRAARLDAGDFGGGTVAGVCVVGLAGCRAWLSSIEAPAASS
jgi:hypothetical protein